MHRLQFANYIIEKQRRCQLLKQRKLIVTSVTGYNANIYYTKIPKTELNVGLLKLANIFEKNGDTYFVTKGDNNNSQDQNLVEFKDVEGIYVSRIGGVGKMLSGLSNPTTIVIIILLIKQHML